MPLTLEDIAKISGVSRSTVSRVVNHDRRVSSTTREHVLEVIEEYNFYPNLAARGLASGHTNVLGVIIPAGVPSLFTDPYFPILLQGVSSACNKLDYSVMLSISDVASEKRLVGRLVQNHLVDGVIVASTLLGDPIQNTLTNSDLPFVIVGRQPNLAANVIDIDNRHAVHQAVDFLIGQGYKRIATITGPLNQMAGVDRLDGYKDALKAAGLKIDTRLIAEGNFTEYGGYQGMKSLLPYKPEAVFAASDNTAIGALHCLNEVGLHVPDDIGLIGFDDIPASSTLTPPLSTVRQPIHGMGEAAAKLLIEAIESGSKEHHSVTLPTELVVRNSTARVNHYQTIIG
ncbi:MAG TPA: LacI family DNA-binding transcriptional regulator [Anaerolineaceae bacterium]|nr:LacI family DNA-binding transcriptional regulator [Anaerolineaceae bacterium]